MNYLAHLHLGGDRPAQLLGSLYGDFVKGSLQGHYPAELEAAIALHRRVDVYTDSHPVVRASRKRFSPKLRRYAGILLDVFFDHCLARDWSRYAEQDLDPFCVRVYRLLLAQNDLPGRLAEWAPRMARQNWLGSYRDQATLHRVAQHLGRRLRRPEAMAAAHQQLLSLYEPLSEDFVRFYPDLWHFALANREPPVHRPAGAHQLP